jgi:hypothetical protein
MTVIYLMPENAQRLLGSYYSCESREQAHQWMYSVADEIIGSVEVLPREHSFYSSDRAYCPLCGSGSTSPYASGFTVPDGLRRHLIGWGNNQQCGVMRVALGLAHDHWDERFSAAEQAEQVEKRKRLESRKRTETLYRTAPDDEPRLLDELIGFGTLARDQGQLAFAENRLAELGFQSTMEANIKSYTNERGDFVVYADPRTNGQITFKVYKKPLPKRRRGPRVRSARSSVFQLLTAAPLMRRRACTCV